jgi:hypothetical protein
MSGWVAGATVAAAGIGAYSSNQAAKKQLEAARTGAAAEERMFNKQVALQQPLIDVRNNMLPELVEASRYTPFGMEQFQADPGYGFRLKEGLRALEGSAAARGGLLSGNALRGVARYGQGIAADEYTNAFNRYQAERQARLGPLQSLVGLGQTSANTVGSAAGAYGQQMAQNAANMGNIRASSYMNTANALAGGIGTGLNYYQNQQMMNRFFPQQQSSGGTAPLGMPGNPFPYDVNS